MRRALLKSRRGRKGEKDDGYRMKPGENIFLLLGFPPDEAERYKADSDRRIAAQMSALKSVKRANSEAPKNRAFRCVDLAPLGQLSADDLIVGGIYMGELDVEGWVRILYASGEDYLYPRSCFEEALD